MRGYPNWFTALFVFAVLFLLFFTGILLAPTTLELRLALTVPWRLGSDNRILVAALHVVVGFLTCGLVGALWSIHMRTEWRRKANRVSGILLVLLLVFLMISGVGIYYLADERMMLLTSGGHLLFGVIVFAIYLWHSVLYQKK